MKTKIYAAILAALMITSCTSLTACGNADSAARETQVTSSQTETAEEAPAASQVSLQTTESNFNLGAVTQLTIKGEKPTPLGVGWIA